MQVPFIYMNLEKERLLSATTSTPKGQPIEEGRGVSLGGFSLNAQLIIPSSYLHTINGALLF